jgi:hypothetical protein
VFRIASNSDGVVGNLDIPLNCNGNQATLASSPTSHNFNALAVGNTATRTFVLTNNGNVSLTNVTGVFANPNAGYSIISPSQGDSAKGLVVGLHVGGMYDVASNLFLNGQVGYQLGFQKLSDADMKSNFLQIGLGVGMRL